MFLSVDRWGNSYNLVRKYRSPMKATFSGAYILGKGLALNVDYRVSFLNPHFSEESDFEKEFNTFFRNYAKPQSEIRIGSEYRINKYRLRAGYGFTDSPFSGRTLRFLKENGGSAFSKYKNLYIGNKTLKSVGLGYDSKRYYIDVSYQNLINEYYNEVAAGAYGKDKSIMVINDAPKITKAKSIQNSFFLTCGFRF